MLQTLLKIGEWQSQGKSEWDRFLEKPKIQHEDKHGNKITNYVLPIIFDLDAGEVIIERENLREYKESFPEEYKLLKTLSARNKKIYGTVEAKKIKNIYNTFFGENIEEQSIEEGHLLQSIKKDYPELLNEQFSSLLTAISDLKHQFLSFSTEINDKTNKKELSLKPLLKKIELALHEELVSIFVAVKSVNHNLHEPVPFVKLDSYNNFLILKLGIDNNAEQKKSNVGDDKKVCYASGEVSSEVSTLNLGTRFSLNKMFVSETKNYASLFSGKNYYLNYQVSLENQEKLDYASIYLLKNMEVRIANIPHVIVPQFQDLDDIDLDYALSNLKMKSDLLFRASSLNTYSKEIETETTNNYWLNFIAFDSDRKGYFKSIEIIKDTNKFHFEKVIKAFEDIDWQFKDESFIDWQKVMTEYGKTGRLNFNSVYGIIPLRKDKEKKNKALDLFKAILENRKINQEMLYAYFSELILCHYYQRYGSYTNISKSSKDYFRISIRNSVFKYLAFFQVLKKLNLIDMNEQTKNQTQYEETTNKYDKAIQDFFNKMEVNQEQQAMFYLGRMLNAVEYIQVKKKIKKTVINLINFNGMDRDDIERLRNDLINKARQHSQVGKVIFTNGKFSELFDYNNWNVRPTEALFFLLTGYSFGTSKTDEDLRLKVEIEEENV